MLQVGGVRSDGAHVLQAEAVEILALALELLGRHAVVDPARLEEAVHRGDPVPLPPAVVEVDARGGRGRRH